MFNKFKLEQNEDDSDITIFCKLMSYFEVPYMAVLIRAYELQLLSDGIVLESLLKTDAASVKQEFSRLWLNDMILYPARRNDYGRMHRQQIRRENVQGCQGREKVRGQYG